MPQTLITEQEASRRLTVSVKTLQAWRVRGGGPRFVKVGRLVRYTEVAIEKFIREHTMASTAQSNRLACSEFNEDDWKE
jgi:predicted DNA-binding transcriptional regulator AlpA